MVKRNIPSLAVLYSVALFLWVMRVSPAEYNTAKDGMLRFTIAIDLYRRSR